VVSDERLVMALLEEGNPATELGDDAWTEVNAATYLATLERRSSEMTQLETNKSRPESQRFWTTPWLAAAIAVIVLGVAVVVVNQANQDSIPLAGADGDPEATEAFKAVEAAYHAFNTGDPAWVEVRLRGSFFESQEDEEGLLSDLLARWPEDQATDPRLEVSGCVSQGHGEWPNVVDEGVPAPTGYYFVCETKMTNALYDVAGVQLSETQHWVVDNGAVVAVKGTGGTSEPDAFLNAFQSWLWQTHPDVAVELTQFFSNPETDPESVRTALEYAEEFVAQSDIYPLETSGS
jgi:hypothetical protein